MASGRYIFHIFFKKSHEAIYQQTKMKCNKNNKILRGQSYIHRILNLKGLILYNAFHKNSSYVNTTVQKNVVLKKKYVKQYPSL